MTKGAVDREGKHKLPRPSVKERQDRLLEEITLHRIQMREAAQALLVPVHRVEELRGRLGGARHWLYPAAPLLALLVLRFKLLPRFRSLPALALRGWTLWRLFNRFR